MEYKPIGERIITWSFNNNGIILVVLAILMWGSLLMTERLLKVSSLKTHHQVAVQVDLSDSTFTFVYSLPYLDTLDAVKRQESMEVWFCKLVEERVIVDYYSSIWQVSR